MNPVELLLSKLPGAKRNGQGWRARCPAHDDRNPSLSIAEGDAGRVLVNCHAGCSPESIVTALGLKLADLMPPANGHKPAPKAAQVRVTPRVFATAAGAVKALEKQLGRRAATWTYRNAEREPAGLVVRWNLPDGGKDIRPVSKTPTGWIIGAMPEPRPLYHLPDLLAAPKDSRVFVVEGEKAADAAHSLGLTATTSAGGAKAAGKTAWSPLAGRDVAIFPDHDEPGERYAQDVSAILRGLNPPATVRVVRLVDGWPDLPAGGDIADVVATGEGVEFINEKMLSLVDAAAPAARVPCQTPHLIRMSDVQPVDVDWLWPGRIPLGRITLLVGRPGEGKSFLTAHLAANVSRGRDWPDGSPCPCGSVVLCSAEDDPADTIAPRLIAHDADRERIHLLAGVVSRTAGGEDVERIFTLADLPALRQTLELVPDCKLIVVDPIGSYLGGGVDSHRDNEVRGVLAPVAMLAAEHDAAVVVVCHTRKAAAAHADDMTMGSRGFTGLARSVLHLMADPDDDTKRRRLLLPGKNNLAEPPAGLAFDIGPGDIDGRPCVRWFPDEVRMTADDVVNHGGGDQRPGPEPKARSQAADWLSELLGAGPAMAATIKVEGELAGYAWRTLHRAKDELGIRPYREAFAGGWWWRLPDPSPQGAKTPQEQLTWHPGHLGNISPKTGFLGGPEPGMLLSCQDNLTWHDSRKLGGGDPAEPPAMADGWGVV